MKFKIYISYDGSKIHGWVGVGNFNYIKDLLQKSIFSFTHKNVNIICASKTDSGVHAEINVCSLDLETLLSEYKICHAMNYFLPDYIRVLSVIKVEDSFNARFHARYRHYKYMLSLGVKRPILRDRILFTGLNSLNNATEFSNIIIGKHNFSSFCPAKTVANKIRTIEQFYLEEIYMFGVKIYIINIVAKSFLHHQVRNIVGALIDIEKGYLSISQVKESLTNGMRIPINMAAALGLYLHNIIY